MEDRMIRYTTVLGGDGIQDNTTYTYAYNEEEPLAVDHTLRCIEY